MTVRFFGNTIQPVTRPSKRAFTGLRVCALGAAAVVLLLAATGLCGGTRCNAQATAPTSTGLTQVVQPAPVPVQWNVPAEIGAGDALSTLELNASAAVPGRFVYSPVAGTVLAIGTQRLEVQFIPDDSNYAVTSDVRSVVVLPVSTATFAVGMQGTPRVAVEPQAVTSTVDLVINPSGDFNRVVHLSCDASADVTCEFSQKDVRPGNTTAHVALTVRVPRILLASRAAFLALPLMYLLRLKRRRRTFGVMTVMAIGLGLAAVSGCAREDPLHVSVVARTSTQVRSTPLDLVRMGLVAQAN